MGVSLAASAQNLYMKAYLFSVGNGDEWTDWVETDTFINVNFDREKITVMMDPVKSYTLLHYGKQERDKWGAKVSNVTAIDQTGQMCTIVFRFQTDGTKQLYIKYGLRSLCYCYNLLDYDR